MTRRYWCKSSPLGQRRKNMLGSYGLGDTVVNRCQEGSNPLPSTKVVGASPSGKASGFDPVIRRFESYRPSQDYGDRDRTRTCILFLCREAPYIRATRSIWRMAKESNPHPLGAIPGSNRLAVHTAGPSVIGTPPRIRTGTVLVLNQPPPTNWARGAWRKMEVLIPTPFKGPTG